MLLPAENKRLRELMELKGFVSENAFADEIGVSSTHINRLFRLDKRNNDYPSVLKSTKVLKAIGNKYPEINIQWFKGEKGKTRTIINEESIDDIITDKLLKKIKPYIDKTIEDEVKRRVETLQESLMMLFRQSLELTSKKTKN